ncbi:MAG: hypothetical protein PHR35_11385, partial [Kiritimatiellae bacterium]|nr:hypothetical protein [Kiritimatiellia bacterium]
MNMPLFVPDLEAMGCEVDCLCLAAGRLSLLEDYLRERQVDLVGLEHMAPYGIVGRAKAAAPATRIVVGGHGFLDIFAKADVDFAIAGAGREALRALVAALRGERALDAVPNLFFTRREAGRQLIDCTAPIEDLSLERELTPFAPRVDWTYLGFRGPTPPVAQRGDPPVLVADLGCPCRARPLRPATAPFALDTACRPLTERAQARFAGLAAQRRSGGCSFCTYGGYAAAALEPTLNLLLEQMAFLQEHHGFQRFAIGSEAPFRFILPLLQRAIARGILLKEVRLRSRVEWILRHERELEETIRLARQHRFVVAVWQVGFESFSDRHLTIFGKRQSVRENVEAVRLLESLERRHTGWFTTPVSSHGFLGNTAWTRLEDVEEQMRQLAPLPHRWRRAIVGGPVKLFDELLPYAQAVRRDGLLVRRKQARDGFRFLDDRIRVLERGRVHFLRSTRPLSDDFMRRAALDAYWVFLGALLPALKATAGRIADLAPVWRRTRRELDRHIDPVLKAQRLYRQGLLAETRRRPRDAVSAYRRSRRYLPESA